MEKDLRKNEIILTALFGTLWGVIEISIGTLLHASKIPFRGTLLTIIAVIIITLSRSFLNYKGSVVAISSVAAAIKLITLPGFNITPFLAIMIEGIMGEMVFYVFSYSLFSSLISGSLILLYTLTHSLIMQGVYFGFGIYNVYLDILNSIGKAINYNGEISYLMIPVIIFIYVLLGMTAGWFGWKTAKRSKEILGGKFRMNNKYFISALCLAALFIPKEYSFYFFPLAVACLLFLDRGLFNFVFKKHFLILLMIFLFLQPLLTGEKNITLLGLNFSSDAFLNGFLMMLRAVVMIPSITYLSKTADKKKLQKIFGRIGIKDFDEIFNYSQQMFPKLKEHTKEFFSSDRKRLYNPVEFIAQFIAFLIKSTQTCSNKPEEGDMP